MTSVDQFDPFERRITDAIDEIADARMHPYLDDILRLTARTAQRRSRSSWRFPSMNRFATAAAAAAIVVAVAGGAGLLRPGANVGGPPSPTPTTTAAPSPTPTPVQAPEALRSTWLAASGPAASGGGPGALLRLVVSLDGTKVSVLDAGVEKFMSSPVPNPTELDLASTSAADGCQIGDLGRYGFAFASDGVLPGTDGTILGLTKISDACAARAAVLDRSWVHAIDAHNSGGHGVSTAFTPLLVMTLPAASYDASVGPDWLTVGSTTPDRVFIAVKNPVGFSDPCSSGGGAKLPVAPTIAAFTAYLQSLPGFTVQSEGLQIDGHPAVHLTIPSVQSDACASHRVNEWTVGATDASGGWALNQGDTDVVYLVEVEGNLVLLQWLGAGVTTAEEKALLSTIRFADSLPQ